MTLPFLLEIGAEEIPDWMIEPALKNLSELFNTVLVEHKLGGAVTGMDATPRRLVLHAEGLAGKQEDSIELVTGPAKSAPPKAVEGFAKKSGVAADQLVLATSERGEYWTLSRKVSGRATLDVLASALPQIVGKIYFPKTMYWTGKGGARFIRPIRWIVALLGPDVVPFEFAAVKSGNTTNGHRILGNKNLPVTIANHREELRKNFVVLSAAERRAMIEKALDERVESDEALVNTLVYLTEYPTPIRGAFDPKYLTLPREILSTVMRHHQRYFSVTNDKGGLAPEFIAVMNTSADPDGLVRMGNERVLRARFNDARFFWDVDQKKKLEDRVEDLKHVTFQAKLGSYFEKTERVIVIARNIAQILEAKVPATERAARLCKTDLTTDMVKEFTDLQGIVGGLYARAQGEWEEVAQAIYDHYRPLNMDGPLPSTLEGLALSIADKIDTLEQCFAIGMAPTGSKDPFALRRAAQGVVRMIVERKLPLPLDHLVPKNTPLEAFLLDRIRYYFKDIRAFQYDEVNAVLASGSDDLVDIDSRLTALAEVRPTENFEPLAASFKRIQNILRQANYSAGGTFDPNLLEPGPEADLYAEFTRVREAVNAYRSKHDYKSALEAIASLRPKVDLFFDKVLVNAPDETIRQNRLTLLNSLLTEFSAIADFSEIVTTH